MVARNLFEPIKVGNDTLGHRIVMAPLTRYRATGHIPQPMMAQYYEQRAQEPGTLIISEATFIHPRAGGFADAPGIWSIEQVQHWKPVTEAVHKQGSYIYLQLWALGRQAIPEVANEEGIDVVSASAAPLDEKSVTPRALSTSEIKEYVQWYATAAKNAVEAGFDGVEIHNANGYLLDQFLHTLNVRDDEYGGSIENRARFTLEVVDAVTEAIGAERTGIRFSPWGTFGNVDYGVSPIPQWGYILAELEQRAQANKRLAYVHLVEPRVAWRVDSSQKIEHELNDFCYQIWQGVIIRCGQLWDYADDFANRDNRTLVGIGRMFIPNPDLVKRIRDFKALTKYDRKTFYRIHKEIPPEVGYIDYPNAN